MSALREFAKNIPGVRPAYVKLRRFGHACRSFRSPFVRLFPAGHFYSPLPDIKHVRAQREAFFERGETECPGVDLQVEKQLRVLNELAQYRDELDFPKSPTPGRRYYSNSTFYPFGDAAILQTMIRRAAPKRIVEVGSGFSSAVMLDANDNLLQGKMNLTFIEPFPQRLNTLLSDGDKHRCHVIEQPVQDVSMEVFEALEADDILFIDSSHVVKIGSDVDHLLWKVLPRLKRGVLIHFHDIFWPFRYPEEWVMAGNAWNESYFLRTFLQYNSAFEIEFFNTYIATMHREALEDKIPTCVNGAGGGLWIRRIK